MCIRDSRIGVVAGEVIGEEFAVLENRIDRPAEKAGVGADGADRRAVARTVRPDDVAPDDLFHS